MGRSRIQDFGSRTLFVVLLILECTWAATFHRSLQAVIYCRCQASFEPFYDRSSQNYRYRYDELFRGDDGYYIADGIKVLNCREGQTQGESTAGSPASDPNGGFTSIFHREDQASNRGGPDAEDESPEAASPGGNGGFASVFHRRLSDEEENESAVRIPIDLFIRRHTRRSHKQSQRGRGGRRRRHRRRRRRKPNQTSERNKEPDLPPTFLCPTETQDTAAPVSATFVPTSTPSTAPVEMPSPIPSALIVEEPVAPSPIPSQAPISLILPDTENPSPEPSIHPSGEPTTASPTGAPSSPPSRFSSTDPPVLAKPLSTPSPVPSSSPTVKPAGLPSSRPSAHPSSKPTVVPTVIATPVPSSSPTVKPTGLPSSRPSVGPTVLATTHPSSQPTLIATKHPSAVPTEAAEPTTSPSSILDQQCSTATNDLSTCLAPESDVDEDSCLLCIETFVSGTSVDGCASFQTELCDTLESDCTSCGPCGVEAASVASCYATEGFCQVDCDADPVDPSPTCPTEDDLDAACEAALGVDGADTCFECFYGALESLTFPSCDAIESIVCNDVSQCACGSCEDDLVQFLDCSFAEFGLSCDYSCE